MTIDDPTMWSRPWTLMIPLKKTGEQMNEFACHEGNYGLRAILSGARAGAIDALSARLLAVGALAIVAIGCVTSKSQEANAPITTQKQGSFAVGGQILGEPNTQSLHCDHGYVDYQIPVNPRRINLVMWHSAAATAWLNRWDGGEGYQSIFLRRGFPVYIWDGPQVGRANWVAPRTPTSQASAGISTRRVAIRHAISELVRGRAVPDEGSRGLEPGVASALPRVRHDRKRATAGTTRQRSCWIGSVPASHSPIPPAACVRS